MKYLYVAPRFHPNQYPIIQGLIKKGNDVTFCVTKIGVTEKHNNVRIIKLSPNLLTRLNTKRWLKKGPNYAEDKLIFWFIPDLKQVKQVIDEICPDIVIIRERNINSLLFYRLTKKKAKVLLYNQGPVFSKRKRIGQVIARKIWFSFFPKIRITVCRYADYPTEKIGYKKDENAFFLPFVPRETIEKREYLINNRINIFACGKYRPYKNHLLLVDAARVLLARGYNNFKITILGQVSNDDEKKYFEKVKNRVKEFCLDNFFDLLTQVPYDDISKFYLRNDIFVLPSRSELANVSILDSMAYGLVTITTSKNGTSDYVEEGYSGEIFKTEDVYDLANKIEKYLKEPNLISKIGGNAMYSVESSFSFETYYSRLQEIIDLYEPKKKLKL